MHAALGRMRGRGAPPEEWLDRLHRLEPTAKLHWVPAFQAFGTVGPAWLVAAHTDSLAVRMLGAGIMARVMALPEAQRPVELIYGAELLQDGGETVLGFYPPDQMAQGAEAVLEDLQRRQRDLADLPREALVQARRRETALRIADEIRHNPWLAEAMRERLVGEWADLDPEFRAVCQEMQDIAHEAYQTYFGQRKSFSSAGRPREVTV